ncbi:MAG: NERD domain-containing protein [Phaeodactylibacter sp.]|nr:NERD domain-containing protein [Phaeodactylibacter sp.]MCB9302639.1 NERD domain-containing protein [Lewinellaceae bacterium]
MSRMVPGTIPSDASAGEKMVFSMLKNDPGCQNFTVLHSLFIARHLKALSGEIDFLVLAPDKGVFVLEVKHGRVSRKEGVWEFTNRFGTTTTSHRGPFRQVHDAMHSLRKILIEQSFGNAALNRTIENVLFGYGVMFTGLDQFYDYGTEAEPWMIYTRQGLGVAVSEYIEALSRGFHEKMSKKPWYDVNQAKPSKEDCENILALIRGDFSYQYTPVNKLFDLENAIETYTREQFHIIDITDYNERCLISGQAGTGKTLIATELFRRAAERGERVGFFCFNKLLGQKIESDAKKVAAGISASSWSAGNLHKYMAGVTGNTIPEEADNRFFQETLPWEFIFGFEEKQSEKFDLLVIDEAQDLITENYLEVFDIILKNGIAGGRWVFFGDFSNQAIYLNDPEQAIRLLSSRANFTRLPPLTINCRNTRTIAREISALTGIDLPGFPDLAPQGDSVDSFFPGSASLMAKKAEEIVLELDAGGIPHDRLVILSPRRLENSCVIHSPVLSGLIRAGKVRFQTIQAFKGLEASYVILTDLNELDTRQAERLLYTGLSRAKIKLYLVLPRSLSAAREALYMKNLKKIF